MKSSPETTHADALSVAQAQIVQLQAVIESLTHQLSWFRQQLFGTESEKRHLVPDAQQLSLGDAFQSRPEPEVPSSEVKAHQRKRAARPGDEAAQPFFDESRVPMETIALPCPLTSGLSAEEIERRFESIGMKLTYRLAQRPGSFVVLKYERAQYKERESGVIACAPAPLGVLEGSRADVCFIAAMVIDKIAYHLPLYRQHQRLIDAGFKVSRQWLTQLLQQAAELLTPIYEAQFDSVRLSRIKSMDETPIRAGLAGPGKMKTGYFWPVYGEHDEICFAFHPSHRLQQQMDAVSLLPKTKQQFVSQMLDTVLTQVNR
jgi:transposase